MSKGAETKDAFDSIADQFGGLYSEFYAGMKKILASELYNGTSIKRVLDLGGGGMPPVEVFPQEIVDQLELFVANDISYPMLCRHEFDHRVNSDAFHLPFKDSQFDTVLVYGCIHHLGQKRYRDRKKRLLAMLQEASRVTASGGSILIQEPTVPRLFEWIERFLLFPLVKGGFRRAVVSIYMYRSSELRAILGEAFDCEVLVFKGAGEILGSSWRMIAPFLFVPFFKIPVGLIPYRYLFCRARLLSKSKEKTLDQE